MPLMPLYLVNPRHIPPSLLAAEITNYQYHLFHNIPIEEFMQERITRRHKSPRYHNLVDSNKAITHLVETAVLQAPDLSTALLVMERTIKAATHCYTIRNWFGMAGLLSGLQALSVHRLTLLHQMLPEKLRNDMEKMESVFSYHRNFAAYRKQMKKLVSPAIPLCFPEIRDLIYLEEQATWKDNSLSFFKLTSMLKILSHIQNCRTVPPSTSNNPALQQVVRHMFSDTSYYLDDDEAYSISCSLESVKKEQAATTQTILQLEATCQEMKNVTTIAQEEGKLLRMSVSARGDDYSKRVALMRERVNTIKKLFKQCTVHLDVLEGVTLDGSTDHEDSVRSQSTVKKLKGIVPRRSSSSTPQAKNRADFRESASKHTETSSPASAPTLSTNPLFGSTLASSLLEKSGRGEKEGRSA
mmetsp:Transcript_18898/g.48060  ORF Transcript_18898/g.48060 Transcript_18898/m.48060 type:complete len:413 (+) Transcript_18898:1-1239(+)